LKKNKKILIIVIALVLLLGLGVGGKFLLDVQAYQKEIAAMEIQDIDLSEVPDGTYEGAYDADLIKVKVAVEVSDHRINDIELLQHDNGKGAPAESVIPEVIESQSLNVEAVSGATNSSKVILKSIELAITGAK
jgi:uncharacterized protein with FMN-binding domain